MKDFIKEWHVVTTQNQFTKSNGLVIVSWVMYCNIDSLQNSNQFLPFWKRVFFSNYVHNPKVTALLFTSKHCKSFPKLRDSSWMVKKEVPFRESHRINFYTTTHFHRIFHTIERPQTFSVERNPFGLIFLDVL